MIIENIKSALDRLSVNKLRTFLTMLGIIIGIASVITITTLGFSLKETIRESLYGSGELLAINMYWDVNTRDGGYSEVELTYDDVIEMKHRYSKYINYIPLKTFGDDFSIKVDSVSKKCQVYGVTDGYEKASDLSIIRGRFITEEDNTNKRYSIVLPNDYVKDNFPSDYNPIGEEITLNGVSYVVVGVYNSKRPSGAPSMMDYDYDEDSKNRYFFYAPYTIASELRRNNSREAIRRFGGGIDYMSVFVKDGEKIDSLKREFDDYVRSVLNTKLGEESGSITMQTFTLDEELEEVSNVLDIITVVISVIAGISLIVGGVGVMNIMLVNVVERTKEIGIRKALGAKDDSIKLQFLTESVVICAIGAIIGVLIGLLLGIAGGEIVSKLVFTKEEMGGIQFVIRPDMRAIIVSVLFSCLIGIIFGSYPAKKAARMSPIDALRFE